MFKSYFKTAFRNLKRNKSYAFINVLGLTIGTAASLLIFLVIQFETSFDNFHPQKRNICRVGSISYSAGSAFPAGPAWRIDFPQLKQVAQIFRTDGNQVTVEGNGTVPEKKSVT